MKNKTINKEHMDVRMKNIEKKWIGKSEHAYEKKTNASVYGETKLWNKNITICRRRKLGMEYNPCSYFMVTPKTSIFSEIFQKCYFKHLNMYRWL